MTILGYENIRGKRLADKDLDELFEGLMLNHINKYAYVLSGGLFLIIQTSILGYCGDPSFLHSISNVISSLKKVNPNLIYG